MFNVIKVRRLDSDTVEVVVMIPVKEFNKTKASKSGLEYLFGTDISNHVYREYGVKACNPTVGGIHDRARKGFKTLSLCYQDTAWQVATNVVRVDFKPRGGDALMDGEVGQVIQVDFVNKKRVA